MFDAYSARLSYKDGTYRERRQKDMVEKMSKDFESDPAYANLITLDPSTQESENKDYLILSGQYLTSTNLQRDTFRNFTLHPEQKIKKGSILYNYEDADWLVVSLGLVGEVYQRGTIKKINYIGKWMNNSSIKQSMGIVSKVSMSRASVDENNFLRLPDDRLEIIFPNSEETKTLNRDIRLIIEKMPYKINSIDRYSHDGLCIILAEEDQIGSNDNLSLDIADYIEPSEPSEETSIYGEQFITYGIDYTYELVNLELGENIQDWHIVAGEEFLAIIDTTDKLKIRIKNDRGLVGEEVVIQSVTNINTYTKTITVRSLL